MFCGKGIEADAIVVGRVVVREGCVSGPSLALKTPRIVRKLCSGTFQTTVVKSSKNFFTSTAGAALVGECTTMAIAAGLPSKSAIRILLVWWYTRQRALCAREPNINPTQSC